jgi:hypothetical protein
LTNLKGHSDSWEAIMSFIISTSQPWSVNLQVAGIRDKTYKKTEIWQKLNFF